jgi:hypothetical protein
VSSRFPSLEVRIVARVKPNRYPRDVLSPGWQQAGRPVSTPVVVERDLVVEDAQTGYCGAVIGSENGFVVLEDRHGRRRSFPLGPGFLIDGRPVSLQAPARRGAREPGYTASGSRVLGDSAGATAGSRGLRDLAYTPSGSLATPTGPARVAQASRLWVEGRHDAELIERVWGDDLRHIGVVVEPLGGIDNLAERVVEFGPTPRSRLGVLVDHLEPGTKETRLAAAVEQGPHGADVLILGHRYIDIWQAVDPAALGIMEWPRVPRGEDWKTGICRGLGWDYRTPADLARAWRRILGSVQTWRDLDRAFVTNVERLIDFVQEANSA